MARARVTATAAGVDVARSHLVPDLSAMAGLKWSAGTTTLLAGLSLPLPLLNQNGGDRDQANAERDAAAFELAAIERQVRAEVIAAGEAAQLLHDRVLALRGPRDSVTTGQAQPVRYLARADEARRIALGAYREGAVPLLQVLDAARTWGEARVTWYRTLYAQHESVVSLLVAEGRDLFVELGAGGAAPTSKETPR
jgi:cobalt-zinc-cadmium efflux system outer membrane protein